MSTPRRTRPPLDRYEPIRTFGGVFGPPIAGAPSTASQATGEAPSGDAVSRGVDLGYRVIEEYMRQGQAFAKSVWPAAAGDSPAPRDPQRLMEKVYQYASDLASVWLEYAQTTMGQMPLSPPMPFAPPSTSRARASEAPPVGGFDIGSHSESKPDQNARAAQVEARERHSLETPSVSVDILSKGRAEVTVELKPGSPKAELAVHDLRAGNAKLPRISGVTVQGHASENRVLVRLKLPDDQPAGTYSGLIVDNKSNLPMGMLSVRVLGRADA